MKNLGKFTPLNKQCIKIGLKSPNTKLKKN